MALRYAGVEHELREVLLKDKPAAMLQASAKGTVPVLCLPEGQVIEESVDVMFWALKQHDPENWLDKTQLDEIRALVHENDFEFKQHLDHYKYRERFPEHSQLHYRTQAEGFLQKLEERLVLHSYLMGNRQAFADIAIFPFVRQFAHVDKKWFDRAPYPCLQRWLEGFLKCDLFLDVMQKHPRWQEGHEPLHIQWETHSERSVA